MHLPGVYSSLYDTNILVFVEHLVVLKELGHLQSPLNFTVLHCAQGWTL